MNIYKVSTVWNDNYRTCEGIYTTKEEAEKHRAYLESLPWSMRPGTDWVVVEVNVFEKFEPYFTDEEIEVGRKWDEEHKEEIINK